MDIEAVACVHNLQYRFSTGLMGLASGVLRFLGGLCLTAGTEWWLCFVIRISVALLLFSREVRRYFDFSERVSCGPTEHIARLAKSLWLR